MFSWGAGGISFADNAAEVSLQVSYPSGKDYVSFYNGSLSTIDESKTDYYVNVHITLLDENGEPATAGPDGEDLSSLTATLTTSLGVAGSIVADEFLSDSEVLHFDVDTGVGPAARGHVRYACQTGCVPGDDTLEATVGSLTASTEVEVKAPDAYDIVIRTLLYTSGAGPTDLFDTISAPSHNAGYDAQAGSDVYFEVWAKEGAGSEFTFAPNLEGERVTVSAYADYDADGKAEGGGPYEVIPVATTTAEFSAGKATGNIKITKGGTLDVDGNAQLRVILTATTNVENINENKIETAQVAPATKTTSATDVSSTVDTDTDYVGMIPQTKNKLVIGRDLLELGGTATGNLIEEIDYWYVLDDETQFGGPRTNMMAVFVADIYGNPVTGVSVAVNSTISSNLLSRGVTDETSGWDITKSVRSTNANDGLAVGVSNVRNEDVPKGSGPIKGTITLSTTGSPSLTPDTATVYLVRAGSGGASLLDLHVDTDYPGTSLTAGTALTVYITDVNGSEGNPTSQNIVEIGDTVIVHANRRIREDWGVDVTTPGQSFLVSGASQSYNQAVTTGYTHKITSSDLGSKGEIKIPIKIWGECTRDSVEIVVVSIAVKDKGINSFTALSYTSGVVFWVDVIFASLGYNYGFAAPQYDLYNDRWITDLQPAEETKVKIKELASGVKAENDDLDADPIVITSVFVTGENSFLTPDSVDTSDDYGNTYNDTPSYGVSADIGMAAPPDATRGSTLTFAIEDAGETGTVTINIDGVGTRVFNILNVSNTPSTKAALSLVLEKEGPALPMAGGEAIVKLTADGTTTSNRQVLISIDTSNSVAGAELREFDGLIYNTSYTASLGGGSPTAQWIRLVVHAPEAGDVVLNAEDTEVGPLDATSLTVRFYPPDHVAPTASIDPSDGGSVPPTGEIVITVSDDVGVKLGDTIYSVDREGSDITNDLNCVTAGDETTEGTITCSKSGGELDLGSYLVSVTPKDLAGNAGTEVTSAFTVSVCEAVVTIDPASAVLIVSETQQFSATTVCNGDSVEGTYNWEIMERGSTGSTIDNNGLYTAGSTGGTDTVKVTDTKNGDASATAQVVVKDCTPSVRIGPSSATLKFTETQQFIAATICNGDTITGSYSWAVSGSAGGSIDAASGLYTAGSTAGSDTVTVTDTKYGDATDSATVVVEPPISCVVSPDPMIRSNLIWLPVIPFVTIAGDGTSFAALSTTVSYSPDAAVVGLPPLILGAETIWQGMLVNPAWLANVTGDQTVTATVTTGTEVVECDFEITLLDFLSLDNME